MSYNLSDPNKLPTSLPTSDLALVIGNTDTTTTGQLTFANVDTSQATGQYAFLVVDMNTGQFSLQNLNITANNGVQLSSDIDSNNISTTISLPDQSPEFTGLFIVTADVDEVPDVPILEIEISNQGIITAFYANDIP